MIVPHARPGRTRGVALVALAALALLSGCAPERPATPPLARGEVRVPGLFAPATVVTDRFGIPHVRAASLHDLYLAWGYVTGRDRLWQLALSRARGEGRSHLWLGNAALAGDGGAQLFRLRERAEAIWRRDRADTAMRAAVEAYAAGINAAIAERFGPERPARRDEFDRLGVRPTPWRPADCVLLLLGLGVTLDLDAPQVSESEAIAQHGAAWLERRMRFEDEDTYDTAPADAPAPGAQAPRRAAVRAAPVLPAATLALAEEARALLPARDPDGADRASNEFVVGAGRTASGRPILANDPHLHLTAPGPFHVVHLVVPGVLDAIGAAVPGLPAIVSGRNDRCAWGVTALGAPVTEVYADTLSADGRAVRSGTGWASVRAEPFHVHLRVLGLEVPIPAFARQRRWTPHGAVVRWDPRHRLALALRWSATEDARITLGRLVGVERSRTAAEVAERYRSLVTPTINVVCADVDGDARYQACGLVPRRPFAFTRGVLPSDGRHEWAGFVPADSMPAWDVPRDRFAVNGNNRPSAAAGWARYDFQQDRAIRMAERLRALPRLTLEQAAGVQNDVHSRLGERTAPWLVACAESLGATLTPPERAAIAVLGGWDFSARRGLVAPTLERWWLASLQVRSRTTGLPGLTIAALQGRAPDAFRAPGLEKTERPALAVRAALRLALDSLTARLGPDPRAWTWGRAHLAHFEHALATALGEPAWEPARLPIDGDGSTVCVGGLASARSFDVEHGPAFRHVVDLAVADSSLAVVPPWNSAALPVDLARAWADHAYVPLLRDPARFAPGAIDRRTLRPD